jgi:PadR family transcriptional regulator, regulatory protein AphA
MSQITPDETLLGLLAAQARHGYQLLEVFNDPAQLGRVWHLSTSQLYAVLKRLDKQGLIVGQEVTSPDAPTRTEYMLTEAGYTQLGNWLHEAQPSASIRRVRVEFLSRLYIARLLNIPTIPIVQRQRAVCEAELKATTALREQSTPGVEYLALDLMIAQLQGVLGWIDRCELVPKDSGELS